MPCSSIGLDLKHCNAMDSDSSHIPSRISEKDKFQYHLLTVIKKMMYVSGETAEIPIETTSIMEDIVRQQVIEMVCPNCATKAHPAEIKSFEPAQSLHLVAVPNLSASMT